MSDDPRPLEQQECVPCKGGVPPLEGEVLEGLKRRLAEGWRLVNGHHLDREIRLKGFRQPMALANRIAEIAEQQRHHPELLVAWGRLRITLYTHVIDGLHANDFILAAKIDALLREGA